MDFPLALTIGLLIGLTSGIIVYFTIGVFEKKEQ